MPLHVYEQERSDVAENSEKPRDAAYYLEIFSHRELLYKIFVLYS